jgi:uncharacterized protein YndB with AHSA1/START domain
MSQVKNERTVVITRIFGAPRSRVFDAWTKSEHPVHWWGPPNPEKVQDGRQGLRSRSCQLEE